MADGYMDIKDADTWFETADHANLDVTGDLEIRFDVALANYDTGTEQILISKFGSGSQKSYEIHMGAGDGVLTGKVTPDGTEGNSRVLKAPGTMASISVSANDRVQIRMTVDISGMTTQFYYRRTTAIVEGRNGLESDTGWTTWGSADSDTSISSIHSGTDKLTVAGGVRATGWGCIGKFYSARVYDGIGGTIVASPDWNDNTDGNWDSPTVTDSDGRGWDERSGQTNPTDWDWIPPTDAAGQVSWAELETPDAPHAGRVSWAEFEVPAAAGQMGRVSWAEFEIPNVAGQQGRVSWAEFEVPNAGVLPFPNVFVEMALDNGPLEPTPITWTDVSVDVQDITISGRGRQHELGRYEAGTGTLIMKGRYGPDHPTLGAKMTLNRKVRVSADPGGSVGRQVIFEAYVTSYRTSGDNNVFTHIDMVDALGLFALMPIGSPYASAVQADDPRAYWPLQELEHLEQFQDRGRNRANGTHEDGVPFRLEIGGESPFIGGGGYSVYTRPWDNDYAPHIELDVPDTLVDDDQSEFTFETWFKINELWRIESNPADGTLLSLYSGASHVLNVNITTTLVPYFQWWISDTPPFTNIVTHAAVSTDEWHHMACVIDNGTAQLYIDGVSEGVNGGLRNIYKRGTIDRAILGARRIQTADPDLGWFGNFSHTAIYDMALTPARVRAHYAARLDSFPEESFQDRFDKIIIDRFNWQASPVTISDSMSDPLINPLIEDTVANESVASYLRKMALSVDGHMFIDRTGAIRADDRWVRMNQAVLVTFDDSDAQLGYVDLQLSVDTTTFANVVNLQTEDGRLYTAFDPAVSDTEPEYKLDIGGLLVTPLLASDYVDALLTRQNTSDERVDSISLRPGSDRPDLWKWAITLDVGDKIIVQRLKDGITFNETVIIEAVSHHIGRNKTWTTSYALSPADPQTYWILGTHDLETEARLAW